MSRTGSAIRPLGPPAVAVLATAALMAAAACSQLPFGLGSTADGEAADAAPPFAAEQPASARVQATPPPKEAEAPPPPLPNFRPGLVVTVGFGDTLLAISRRYGVAMEEIVALNDLIDPDWLWTGQRLRLPMEALRTAYLGEAPGTAARETAPRVDGEAAGTPRPGAGAAEVEPPAASTLPEAWEPGAHDRKTARRPEPAPPAPAREARAAPASAPTAVPASAPAPATAHARAEPAPEAPPASSSAVASASSPAPAPATRPARAETAPSPSKLRAEAASLPLPPSRNTFLWPIEGQVISGFGSKPGGRHNDGINIAAPVGSDIRASRSGVVAYAGNELRGYGNLVLIRHDGGWMTAYAHNDSLLVGKGGRGTARPGDLALRQHGPRLAPPGPLRNPPQRRAPGPPAPAHPQVGDGAGTIRSGEPPAGRAASSSVMPGLVPGIHVPCFCCTKNPVDGRNKSGHDDVFH